MLITNYIVFIFYFCLTASVQAQDTQGFFINGWQPKKAVIPASVKIKQANSIADVTVNINQDETIAKVSLLLFGNNTNPYMTQIVTEPKLLQQIQELQPNILRFPGGNISNTYFWDALPNQKPADVPDTILYGDNRRLRKERFFVGRNDAPGTFSLDNYYKLLQLTNSSGTICVNAGYARYGLGENPIATAAHYAAEWVRYDKGRTKYWEVGNEDYGTWQAGYKIDISKNKDGQPEITNGELYGKIFKAFSDSMHAAAKENGNAIYIGATIIEAPKNSHENTINAGWNAGFFKIARDAADFFIVHSYYTPYNQNSKPEVILLSATVVTDKMMQYLEDMTKENNVLLKPVALTEWNIFAEGSKQQTSYINGMHAAIVLGEMAKNKFGMACRWNLANGYGNGNDHGLFNKGDEPGMPKWSARPAYYYMYYFQKYFGDKIIQSSSDNENVIVFTSSFSDGKKGLVLVNKDSISKKISIHFGNKKNKGRFYVYTLTGGKDNGLFSRKVIINDVETGLPAGGPENFESIKAWSSSFDKEIKIVLPAMAVQYVLVD
jgi:hypothetical protein